MPESDSIKALTLRLIEFRDERDWAKYHSLKNLAINLSVEASELLELFMWSDEPRLPEEVENEAADTLYALLIFCHEAGIDLGKAMLAKLEHNAAKYPADKVRGSSKKYDQY